MGLKRKVWERGSKSIGMLTIQRAWLRTADQARCVQQVQLRLISDNISFPVATEAGVYESILKCWTTAMLAMDDLIQGKPQRVQNGALLLALSAWHLYPDISVQSNPAKFVEQKDTLINPGGVITVGLNNHADHADEGVFWSLPLAHLKVYGKPIVITRHNGISHTQVTFFSASLSRSGKSFQSLECT